MLKDLYLILIIKRSGLLESTVWKKIEGNLISVKCPKAELTVEILDDRINYEINENNLNFSRSSEVAEFRSVHGLYISFIANNIQGVLEGYKKTLLLQGVGHR